MSNVEKAIETIVRQNTARRNLRGDIVDIVTVQAATEYVQALADAGLLMPDLPHPNSDSRWESDAADVELEHGEGIWIHGYVEFLYLHEARPLALALLAAANHAEQEQE